MPPMERRATTPGSYRAVSLSLRWRLPVGTMADLLQVVRKNGKAARSRRQSHIMESPRDFGRLTSDARSGTGPLCVSNKRARSPPVGIRPYYWRYRSVAGALADNAEGRTGQKAFSAAGLATHGDSSVGNPTTPVLRQRRVPGLAPLRQPPRPSLTPLTSRLRSGLFARPGVLTPSPNIGSLISAGTAPILTYMENKAAGRPLFMARHPGVGR